MKWFYCLLLAATLNASWEEKLKGYVDKGSPPQWMVEQIRSDLEGTEGLGSVGDAMKKHRGTLPLVQCTVRGGKLSFDTDLTMPRVDIVKEALERLHSVAPLPDVDFLISMGDFLLENTVDAPVFAFATNKNENRGVILIPDHEALQGNLHLMDFAKRAKDRRPWKKKIPQVIWRGAMSGMNGHLLETFKRFPRSQAVLLSEQHPKKVKAHFISRKHNAATEEVRATYPQYFASFLPVKKQMIYKYQLLVDGHSCAYSRALWQLFSDCVIFKQDSKAIQWYHQLLCPYDHYIPVANDLSDFMEKLEWAEKHDETCKEIAMKGRNLAKKHLSYGKILYYTHLAISEYAKRQET